MSTEYSKNKQNLPNKYWHFLKEYEGYDIDVLCNIVETKVREHIFGNVKIEQDIFN